ncbi:MAG TPA: ABC transporter permease [Epulopiscium sp.]|nr:ABC transporter permease [Candidatus Epulonipiscium sp.]
MNTYWVMLKANFKLVFRNKQTLFLIILIPLLSTLILGITSVEEGQDPAREFKMNVLVVDESKTVLSQELINSLQQDPGIALKVSEEKGISTESIKEFSIRAANKSVATSIIYIPSDFEKKILQKDMQDIILLFETGTDERVHLLEAHLEMVMSKLSMFSKIASGNEKIFTDLLEQAKKNETKDHIVMVDDTGESIRPSEKSYSFLLGMFVAALTMTLIFSNNFIVGIFIEEKHNRVLKRIQLTSVSMLSYVMVKATLALGALIVQTGLIMFGINTILQIKLQMSIWIMGFLIFGLGLVFTCISICSVSFTDNIATANYIGFGFVTITNMLAGLYFPFENVPVWMKNIALLLPQRWFVLAANRVLQGNHQVLYHYGMVIGALMVFFLAASLLGFKLNKGYS